MGDLNFQPISAERNKHNEEVLGALLRTVGGRDKLAASLGPSLRMRKQFMSFASAPTIHTQDSVFIRHLDKIDLLMTEGCGDVIYKNNYDGEGVIEGHRLPVPVFGITSNPMILVDDLIAGRHYLVARSLNLAKAEVGVTEDAFILDLWDTAAKMANNGEIDGNPDFPYGDFSDSLKAAEERFKARGLTMRAVFVNPRTGGEEVLKDCKNLIPATERKDLIRGICGWVNDVEIRSVHRVDPGFAYFTAEKISADCGRVDLGQHNYTRDIYAAYIIEERALEAHRADREELGYIGFAINEEMGFAANPVAVQRVVFDPEWVKKQQTVDKWRITG